jgi:hypothetical protein
MITAGECQEYIDECEHLGTDPKTSVQRATIIMAMRQTLVILDAQIARYDTIVGTETTQAAT